MFLSKADITFLESIKRENLHEFSNEQSVLRFLGIIETCVAEMSRLEHQIQELSDGVDRLRQEKKKPKCENIRKSPKPKDLSSTDA
ncbi:MAG: hypothetical protein STSR0009_01900 [Methanoregula sp.]